MPIALTVHVSLFRFIMEPLMNKNDNFSFSFYKTLLEKMKSMRDKRKPEDELANQVLL